MQHSTFVSSRDHRSIALLMVLGGVGVAGLAVDPAEAALMTYTLDGGTATITGSVGSTIFANASWTLTATADSSQAQLKTISAGAAAYVIPTTVTLRIGGTSSPVATVTMSDYSSGGSNFSWLVFSVDFGSGAGAGGFGPGDLSTNPLQIDPGADVRAGGSFGGTPGIYNNLSVSGVWTGQSLFWIDSQDYQTSGGLLDVTNVVNGIGTWTIANASAVPGGGGAFLLAAGVVRRRRR